MVSLLNLVQFASKYFYTTSADEILFKNYLDNVKYEKGSLFIDTPTEVVGVEQNVSIIIKNNNNIQFNFDYLPLEQEVKIVLNGLNVSNANINRDTDTLIVTNNKLVENLKLTVSKYEDTNNITYHGLNRTFQSIFSNLNDMNIEKKEDKWRLQSETAFNVDISSLSCSGGVTLTDYVKTSREAYCTINFPTTPKSFTITKQSTSSISYFNIKCTYNKNSNSFTLGASI